MALVPLPAPFCVETTVAVGILCLANIKKLRICIADSHEISRRGLSSMIDDHPDWALVGEASDVRSAVKLARQLSPDIMILDVALPEIPQTSGLDAARQIRAATAAKVLMFAAHGSEHVSQQSFEAGAHGFILKSDSAAELIRAVEAISQGKRYLTPRLAEGQANASTRAETQPEVALTPRELELVRHLCDGSGNKEIAVEMGFSIRTVETYRAAVKAKLGLKSTAEIIRWAIRNHLIVP